MKPCFFLRHVVRLMLRSGRAPADGVPFSANVPRPSASSFISLRKAPHRRVRDPEQSLIGDTPAACPSAQGIGCSPQRNKGGAEGGGHSRRGVPGGLCTRPEQQRREQKRAPH